MINEDGSTKSCRFCRFIDIPYFKDFSKEKTDKTIELNNPTDNAD